MISNDDDLAAEVEAAGATTGELVWRLPLHPEYKELTKGTVADLTNASAKRKAGTIYAGSFLEEFVGDTPWAHVDIAGTAWDVGREYTGNDASGYGVRLLVELASPAVAVWPITADSLGRRVRGAAAVERGRGAMSAKQLLPLSGVVVGAADRRRRSSSSANRRTLDDSVERGHLLLRRQRHRRRRSRAALLALGAFFFLLFSADGRRAAATRPVREAALAGEAVSLAGGIVFAVGATIFAGLAFTAGDVVDDVDAGHASRRINALEMDMFFTVAVGTAAFLLGSRDRGPLKTERCCRLAGAGRRS